MRTALILICSCLLTVSASTGYIEGVITSIGDQEFIITGVDRDKNEQEARDHKIPGKGVGLGKDYTIFAVQDGHVKFRKGFKNRTFVSVVPAAEAAE